MKIAKKFGVLAAAIALVISTPAIASANETGKELRGTTTKNNIHDVIRKADDKCGRHAILRRGYYDSSRDKGVGWDKMYYKHNIKKPGTFNFVLGNPNCGIASGGQSRTYDAYVHRVQCGGAGGCQIISIRRIILVHDYRNDPSIPGTKGVITAYCEGETRCEEWVNDSINIKSANTFTVFKYSKLDPKRKYTETEIRAISKH